MTQSDLAQQADISQRTISDIETGKHVPTVYVAIRIAKALKVKVEDLFKEY